MSNPTASLPLFADVPDVRSPAPSAPGSVSSQRAADAVSGPFRRHSLRRIMTVLAASERPLSRAELAERCPLPINVICARVKEDLMPMWVEAVPDACESKAKPGLRIEGLRLTDAGRARMRSA